MPAVRKNIFHIFSFSLTVNSKYSIMDRGHSHFQEMKLNSKSSFLEVSFKLDNQTEFSNSFMNITLLLYIILYLELKNQLY